MEEAEAKFKNYIAEYRDRAVKHANQINKEVTVEGSLAVYFHFSQLPFLFAIWHRWSGNG